MSKSLRRFDQQTPPHPHELSCAGRVTLEIVRGRARERFRDVSETVFLMGSAADCDLVLGDAEFPSAYAYLYVTTSAITVRYLGGGPPLLVGGANVSTVAAVAVHSGDLIELGSLALRLHVETLPPEDLRTHFPREWTGKHSASEDVRSQCLDAVRALLAIVRQAMESDLNPIRLYRGPEEPAGFASQIRRRASA